MRMHPPFGHFRFSWRMAAFPGPAIARILLLEDEEAVRSILAEALARHGYIVMAGGSLDDGLETLSKVGWERIDLVLTDTHLSREVEVKNGYAFHACWRSLYPVPPFIFMDGWGGSLPAGHPSCQVYGLAKPFELAVLVALIRAILGR